MGGGKKKNKNQKNKGKEQQGTGAIRLGGLSLPPELNNTTEPQRNRKTSSSVTGSRNETVKNTSAPANEDVKIRSAVYEASSSSVDACHNSNVTHDYSDRNDTTAGSLMPDQSWEEIYNSGSSSQFDTEMDSRKPDSTHRSKERSRNRSSSTHQNRQERNNSASKRYHEKSLSRADNSSSANVPKEKFYSQSSQYRNSRQPFGLTSRNEEKSRDTSSDQSQYQDRPRESYSSSSDWNQTRGKWSRTRADNSSLERGPKEKFEASPYENKRQSFERGDSQDVRRNSDKFNQNVSAKKRESTSTGRMNPFDEISNYHKFLKENRNLIKVKEIQLDLFQLPKEYSLAHCVAADMAMGSGIAVQFKRDFKRVPELYAQKAKQGGLAVLEDNNRFIYYLVTKPESNDKPTYETLLHSLHKLKQHVENFQVKKLGMPRIGCGLDRLEWSRVSQMLEYVFQNTDVEITVCNFQQPEQEEQRGPFKPKRCLLIHAYYPLVDIDIGTIITYFGSEDGTVSPQMQDLDNKFRFISNYKLSRGRRIGEILTFDACNRDYVLCGFIVKKCQVDEFDFLNFQKCVVALNKWNSKMGNKYQYVGLEPFVEKGDDLIMSKVIHMLRDGLKSVEIHFCHPGGGDAATHGPSYYG